MIRPDLFVALVAVNWKRVCVTSARIMARTQRMIIPLMANCPRLIGLSTMTAIKRIAVETQHNRRRRRLSSAMPPSSITSNFDLL